MARFSATVESATALAANTVFANLVPGASSNLRIRKGRLGCRAGAAVPTSQQVSVAIVRATARGTASTTKTGQACDPRSLADTSTGIDTAWSVNPTLASNNIGEVSFNTQGFVEIPYELLDELVCDQGTANGIAFENLANALPTGHLLTLELEWEI